MSEQLEQKKLVFKELSFEIIAAALEVHRELGPGFTENIYEAAFCRELAMRGIMFSRQLPIEIKYKGEDIGKYQLDLLVDDRVVVELKAISQMPEQFESQLHAYLKATGKKLGILINFGRKSLEHKRLVH